LTNGNGRDTFSLAHSTSIGAVRIKARAHTHYAGLQQISGCQPATAMHRQLTTLTTVWPSDLV